MSAPSQSAPAAQGPRPSRSWAAWLAALSLAACLALCGCQAPPPNSTRAKRDANIRNWFALYSGKEKHRPQNAEATLQRLRRYLEGDPEGAERTARRLLELD